MQRVAFQFSPITSISSEQKPLNVRLTTPTLNGSTSETKKNILHQNTIIMVLFVKEDLAEIQVLLVIHLTTH